MKDYSCELGAACGPEAAAGRELAAVRKRRCVAEEAQVAGEGDELLLLLFVRAVVRDDAHLFGYVGEARHLTASGRMGAAGVLPRFGKPLSDDDLARAMEAAKIGAERAVLGSRFPSSPLPDKRGPGKL